jgi:hypothetical protein
VSWKAKIPVALLLAVAVACPSRGPSMGPVMRLNEDEGRAAAFSWAYYTSIVAEGPRVAVAWMNANGKTNRDVMTRQSVDRGETWSPELALNAPEFADTVSVVPALHVLENDGALLALWQARRNRKGQKFVLVRRSEDFAASFGSVRILNQDMQSFLPVLAEGEEGDIIVAWTDEREVYRDIYVNRSSDGGRTWLDADIRLSRLPATESGAPAVAIGPGRAASVVWEERPRSRKIGEAHLAGAVSRDAGESWGPAFPVVPEESLPVSPMWPQIVVSQGRITLVWAGGVTGNRSQGWLWTSWSEDGGATWSEPSEIYSGPSRSFFHLATEGPRVYLVWHGSDGDEAGAIFFNASDDGGRTWRHPWNEPERIDEGGGNAFHPRLAVERGGENLAVTWQEGGKRVAVAIATDFGRTWSLRNATVMTEEEDGVTLRNPQVAVTGDAAYVLWERWPNPRVYVKTLVDVERVLPKNAFVRRVDLPS